MSALSTPRWWYRRGARPLWASVVLTPLSGLWAASTAKRLREGRPVDPGAPVICVGNLTAGGAGKTPVVRTILQRLRARGLEAVGLSRGYGGSLGGPVKVDPARNTVSEVGDEPLMAAQTAPFWIARDRAAGALAAAKAGAQAIVMDDGHQNPAVKKALSLVVIDGETRDREWPFGDGGVIPAGPMREPLAVGLARADAVIVMLPSGVSAIDSELGALLASKPVLIARLLPAAPPPSGPQYGFAGIGKPWRVERALREAGCDLVGFAAFADHQPYADVVLENLARRAGSAGLITTEKDWIRLPDAWREQVTAWPVVAVFDDEAALDRLLADAISARP